MEEPLKYFLMSILEISNSIFCYIYNFIGIFIIFFVVFLFFNLNNRKLNLIDKKKIRNIDFSTICVSSKKARIIIINYLTFILCLIFTMLFKIFDFNVLVSIFNNSLIISTIGFIYTFVGLSLTFNTFDAFLISRKDILRNEAIGFKLIIIITIFVCYEIINYICDSYIYYNISENAKYCLDCFKISFIIMLLVNVLYLLIEMIKFYFYHYKYVNLLDNLYVYTYSDLYINNSVINKNYYEGLTYLHCKLLKSIKTKNVNNIYVIKEYLNIQEYLMFTNNFKDQNKTNCLFGIFYVYCYQMYYQ